MLFGCCVIKFKIKFKGYFLIKMGWARYAERSVTVPGSAKFRRLKVLFESVIKITVRE